MLDKDTYKRELVRMWDSLRTENKGDSTCYGVSCEDCPLSKFEYACSRSNSAFETVDVVERWSKEHPPKKYKVSKMEYDILEINLKYIRKYHWKFNQARKLCDLLEKGYFEGATSETYINDYFDNCELDCELGENKNVKRRKV